MYEHWRQVTYFDNQESVFPSDDLLDDLHVHDTYPRSVMYRALNGLIEDFEMLLHAKGAYDWFYSSGYKKVFVNNETLLFA